MATPTGTNLVTALTRRYVVPEIVDAAYKGNALLFRWNKARKKYVRGGSQIEIPVMHRTLGTGQAYSGFDPITLAAVDQTRTLAFDWKQVAVPWAIDGLTVAQFDSPESVVEILSYSKDVLEMEMADTLGNFVWGPLSNASAPATKEIDAIKAAVNNNSGVLGISASSAYGGITRASGSFHNSQIDSSTSTLTEAALNSMWGNVAESGQTPTAIFSRYEQFNRFLGLGTSARQIPITPEAHDEILFSAGFTNGVYRNVPWIVDPKVPDGPNSSNSAIYMLNERYWSFAVHPRADFYLRDWREAESHDVMSTIMFWYGNVMCSHPARQGVFTNISG